MLTYHSVKKLRKLCTGPAYMLFYSSTVISDVQRSFIPNKTLLNVYFTKYCLTQRISKLPRSFEIHWVRQYLVNCLGLMGIVNATVYKTELIFTGLGLGKLSYFLTLISLLGPRWGKSTRTEIKIFQTRQIRTPVLRIPPAVTSQAKMKNWLHECQKWVSHMIGQYGHI